MRDDHALTLIIGGARSGKSAHAELLVRRLPPPWYYVATAAAEDDEMRQRVELHRNRRGPQWHLLESPLELADALMTIPPSTPVLVDCLTLWLSNHLLSGSPIDRVKQELVNALEARRSAIFVVSSEVGQGIVPETALGRAFRDLAGQLNQAVAAVSDHVILMVAGLPVQVK